MRRVAIECGLCRWGRKSGGSWGAGTRRLLKRIHLHGLIEKIGRTYMYYLTHSGKQVITTGRKLRDLLFIPQPAFRQGASLKEFLPAQRRISMDRY